MALKPDRSIVGNQSDISFFYNSVAEKGEVLVFSTAGSGASMDDANAVVARPSANPSGEIFAGIALNDMVNKDLTQTHINFHKDEMQQGGKMTLAQAPAVIVTDMIASGESPTLGAPLYFRLATHNATDETNRGVLTTTVPDDSGVLPGDVTVAKANLAANKHKYQIGVAMSVVDADNYLKVKLVQPR